jgi:hypothetical protein
MPIVFWTWLWVANGHEEALTTVVGAAGAVDLVADELDVALTVGVPLAVVTGRPPDELQPATTSAAAPSNNPVVSPARKITGSW